jgi:TonB family protein
MVSAVLALLALAGQPSAACPQTPIRVTTEAHPELPPNPRPTNAKVGIVLDVGSDGRVRRAALTESSGDPAVDRATLASAERQRFAAPSFACVAFSAVFLESFEIPPDALASPAPSAAPVALCGPPFVTPAGVALSGRSARGTVAVDVQLDAAAHVDGARLAQSSGNAATDRAALDAARASGYRFVSFPGCPPAPTTYRLELTFG